MVVFMCCSGGLASSWSRWIVFISSSVQHFVPGASIASPVPKLCGAAAHRGKTLVWKQMTSLQQPANSCRAAMLYRCHLTIVAKTTIHRCACPILARHLALCCQRPKLRGAIKDRVGRFELADGGTLFLDEIGEIPLDLQSKLLRVLQEGQFERVGDERTRTAKVRLIVATNRDLLAEAKTGQFRLDLYYRLSVFPIEVPPLRERLEDIGILAEHFIKQAGRRL